MIFLDSTFLIGFFCDTNQWHDNAVNLYSQIKNKTFVITFYIISETITMVGKKEKMGNK